MPVNKCTLNGKPGYRWGEEGKCYTYDPLIKTSEEDAKQRARAQGIAQQINKIKE